MTGGLMLADRLTDVWASAMWRACWQGALALLVVWAWCRLVAARAPARVKCWLWRLAYAKLLVSLVWFSPAGLPLLRANHNSTPAAPGAVHVSPVTDGSTFDTLPKQTTATADLS